MNFFRQYYFPRRDTQSTPAVGRPYIVSFYEHQEFF